MAKQGRRQPPHVRIPLWFEAELAKILDEEHEEILDIHWRHKTSPAGPAGWNVIIQRTVLGQSATHGVNFGSVAQPDRKGLGAAMRAAREELDKSVAKKQLIVDPKEVPSGLRG